MTPRKIQRKMIKDKMKNSKRKERKKNKSDFSWDTVNELRKTCVETILNNTKLLNELIKHDDLKNAKRQDIQRLITISAKVTTSLLSDLNKIDEIQDGRTGPLKGYEVSTDYDDALIIFDKFQSLASAIPEQYAHITDAIYVLRTQLNTTVLDNEKK